VAHILDNSGRLIDLGKASSAELEALRREFRGGDPVIVETAGDGSVRFVRTGQVIHKALRKGARKARKQARKLAEAAGLGPHIAKGYAALADQRERHADTVRAAEAARDGVTSKDLAKAARFEQLAAQTSDVTVARAYTALALKIREGRA